MSQSEMARILGCTRQRISQLVQKMGIPTALKELHYCKYERCHNTVPSDRVFCDAWCRFFHTHHEMQCIECNIGYWILESEHRARQKKGATVNFCGRKCLGKYLGTGKYNA